MDHIYEHGHTQLKGLPNYKTADSSPLRQHRTEYEQRALADRKSSLHIPWDNSPLDKNLMAETGIKPGASCSVGNDITN